MSKQEARRRNIKTLQVKTNEEEVQKFEHEVEQDKVKDLELWEQQNTNTELNFYAANLSVKIRSTVCKKENNSPRVNSENINLIKKDPDNYITDGNRERAFIKDF